MDGAVMNALPNPWDFGIPPDDHRFVLDEAAFMEAIEPLPMFLTAPTEVLAILEGYQ